MKKTLLNIENAVVKVAFTSEVVVVSALTAALVIVFGLLLSIINNL